MTMIVLSEAGSFKLMVHGDWDAEARRRGIRDPFKVSQKIFSKYARNLPNGCMEISIPDKPDPDEPSEEEKYNFIVARDTYIAERLFHELSYEAFVDEVNHSYKDCLRPLLDRMFPCESATGQCSLFCKKYEECNHEILD